MKPHSKPWQSNSNSFLSISYQDLPHLNRTQEGKRTAIVKRMCFQKFYLFKEETLHESY